MTTAVGSGSIVRTTTNIEAYATRIAQESDKFRSCGIAIGNNIDFILSQPRRYLTSGRIVSMPLIIKPGYSGLILCENRATTPEGSCGLITYKIEESESILQQLQIAWYVPFDLNIHSCQVNVRIGVESASEDIYHNMMNGVNGYGNMIPANQTLQTINIQEYVVNVLMGGNGKAPLTVYIAKN